jgi:hypothetical protein
MGSSRRPAIRLVGGQRAGACAKKDGRIGGVAAQDSASRANAAEFCNEGRRMGWPGAVSQNRSPRALGRVRTTGRSNLGLSMLGLGALAIISWQRVIIRRTLS